MCKQPRILEKQLNTMSKTPRWAYLIVAIMIVTSGLLALAIVWVVSGMLPQGMDIQIPLFFLILPLSSLLVISIIAMLLTRKRE